VRCASPVWRVRVHATVNGLTAVRARRRVPGVGVQISHDEYTRVARFTQCYHECYPQGAAPATADRTLGTHDGSARGQGPCAGGDRRIKPVDVIKRNLFVRGPLRCFQVKMHVITANIFLAGLRKIAVMFSAMLHLARVC